MIRKPTAVRFFVPTSLEVFDATAEPTLEGLTGEDYLGNALADTDQVINAMDGYPRRTFLVDTDAAATQWRVDCDMARRMRYSFLMVDHHNLRGAYPNRLRGLIATNHHTADVFGSATKITPNKILSGQFGREFPYIDLDGDDNYCEGGDHADLNVTTGDFALVWHIRPASAALANQYLIHKEDTGVGYGLEIREDDLWIRIDDGAHDASAKIATAFFVAGDELWIWVDFDRSGNAVVYVKVNDGDLEQVGTVDISSASSTLNNGGDLHVGSAVGGGSKNFYGRIYQGSKWSRISASSTERENYIKGIRPSSGILVEWTHDGLDPVNEKWYNSEGSHTLSVSGAEFKDVETSSDEFGFYLSEFDETEARYWFIEMNDAGSTGESGDNALVGQVALGEMFSFNGLKPGGGYAGEYGYPGIIVTESDAGRMAAERRYGVRPSWDLQFQISTQAHLDEMQRMVDALEGALYPFWVCFNYDDPMPVIWRVRLEGPLNWSYDHGRSQPYTPGFGIVADI